VADHLDTATVKALGNKPLYLVPLGVKSWYRLLSFGDPEYHIVANTYLVGITWSI
jgi:L-ascorbate metabolism protein UlaG (beta-lactamase superfamily)